MKILMIGDVVSTVGCEYVRSILPNFKNDNKIDVVIANGENSAVGNGILPTSADFLFDSGVDIITTGNHVYKRKEIYDYIDRVPNLLRPANYNKNCNGKGYFLYQNGSINLLVINLLGVSFMEPIRNPFDTIDEILKNDNPKCIVVDFHCEATGEKKAMGYYLDGRVSAVVGTHTHVQTSDEQILENKTAYITDLGMTGPVNSVIGIKPECIIKRFKDNMPVRFDVASGKCQMQGVIIELDKKTGCCNKIERICI